MDSATGSSEHSCEQVREPGIETRAHEGRLAITRRGIEPFSPPVAEVGPCQIAVRRGDDIRTTSQESFYDLHVELCCHERHAVRTLCEQHLDVISREDSGIRSPGELSRIHANFVRRVHIDAHKLELWVIDDGGERSSTHLAGRPLHDSVRPHFPPFASLEVDSERIGSGARAT